jgi:hypothetical protein
VNVDAPLWVLLTTSAFGGAVFNGVVALGLRFLDRPLRHDDARREHYVNMMTALDELHQALINATQANNNRVVAEASCRGDDHSAEASKRAATSRAFDTASQVSLRHEAARRAERSVGLFAPRAVVRPLNMVMRQMSDSYAQLAQAVATEPVRMEMPPFPDRYFTAFQNAVRKSLGVRKLRLDVQSSVTAPEQKGDRGQRSSSDG